MQISRISSLIVLVVYVLYVIYGSTHRSPPVDDPDFDRTSSMHRPNQPLGSIPSRHYELPPRTIRFADENHHGSTGEDTAKPTQGDAEEEYRVRENVKPTDHVI